MTAHVGINDDPAKLHQLSIRGQFVQSFETSLSPGEVVAPDVGKTNAKGSASVRYQRDDDARALLCLDATITGFDPKVADLHVGKAGSTGTKVVNFSTTRLSKGRFLGCVGSSKTLVKAIIDNPASYYLTFHQGAEGSSTYKNSIRGNLDKY